MDEYRDGLHLASEQIRPTGRFAFRVGVTVMIVFFGLGMLGYSLSWFGEAARVTREQFGPSALLTKYEWFKDASAQLDKKQADIGVYGSRMKAMDETYKDTKRVGWPREDREQYNVWSSETAGVKASFNSLAAEYNAQMAKFNYAFANQGALPAGAEKPLPREYKPYIAD